MLPNWHSSLCLLNGTRSNFPTPLALSSQAEDNRVSSNVKGNRTSPNYVATSLVVARARVAIIYRKWPPGELCRVHFNNPAIKFALWRHAPRQYSTACIYSICKIRNVQQNTYNVQQNTWPGPRECGLLPDCQCLLQALVYLGQTENSQTMVHSSLCITLETACVAQIISDVVTYNLAQGGDHSKSYQKWSRGQVFSVLIRRSKRS